MAEVIGAATFDPDDFPMFDGLLFLVRRPVANTAAGTCTFELQSLDPACYAFDPATEEGTPPVLPNVQAGGTVDAPTGLRVTVERRAASGANNATFLRLAATRPTGREDLSLLGRYRLRGATDWTNMAADSDDAFSLTSGVLQDGGVYEVQGALATYGQALTSAYVAASGSPITAVSDPNPPGRPYSLAGTGGPGYVDLTWTNGATGNVATAQVAVDGGSTPGPSVSAGTGTSSSARVSVAAGPHTFAVTNRNASGAQGPSSAVITVSAT